MRKEGKRAAIVVSSLREADLPQLAELYRELIEKPMRLDRMSAVYAAMRDNPHYVVLAAKDGEKLVGSIMGVVCLDLFGSCDPFMVAENMIVAGSHRQAGVGTLLMAELERRAQAFNCHYVMLVSNAARESAHAFYETLGYDRRGVVGFKKYLHR